MSNKDWRSNDTAKEDRVERAGKEAVRDELNRRRKPGFPIFIGRNRKVIILLDDKVIEEYPYLEEQPE